VAASSIGQYEKLGSRLGRLSIVTVEMGLGACFPGKWIGARIAERERQTVVGKIGRLCSGSDQGLVGQF